MNHYADRGRRRERIRAAFAFTLALVVALLAFWIAELCACSVRQTTAVTLAAFIAGLGIGAAVLR